MIRLRANASDYAHTIGLLSVAIEVVQENSENATDDSEGEGTE